MEERGKRDEDNSGCTYHPDQNGRAHIMDKLAEPTCTDINKDPKRQRVCACQGTTFQNIISECIIFKLVDYVLCTFI